jgi:hypothetical protein
MQQRLKPISRNFSVTNSASLTPRVQHAWRVMPPSRVRLRSDLMQ